MGITGSALLDSDEMVAAERDTTIASVIAVVGVTLLYFAMFKGVAQPLLALGTLLIAVCWSLGFTTLTVGHLNIFSIVFMPMLLGLGIDYGSYFIARFEEEQVATREIQPALVRTFVTTGPGVAATALTTAFTFGTLLLPGFKGIAELGFIGGSSILLTLLATFTVLPALLVWHERRRNVSPTSQRKRCAEILGDYLAVFYRYPRAILAASALLVGLSLWFIGRVGPDFNLLHLQARGTESVLWEQKIFESTKQSPLFGELAAESLAEVKRKVAALKTLPSVAKVESIMSVIPEDQAQKLPLIEALRPLLADISLQGGKAEAVDLDALRSILGRIGFKMADNDGGQASLEDATRQQMQEVRRLATQFIGPAALQSLLDRIAEKTRLPATSTVLDVVAATKRLGLEKIAVANKWTEAMNQTLAQFFAKENISVVGASTQPMNPSQFVKMTSGVSLHLAYALGRSAFEQYPDAEGVYIEGGAWLTLPVIGRLEAEFGKPVITNQVATVWHTLQLLDCWAPLQGFGRLLLSS